MRYDSLKRGFEAVAAGILLLVLSPLLAAVALAVRRSGPGPILFRQGRVGLRGKPFDILKFRTMRTSPDAGPLITSAGDPRVTRVGRVLRRWKLDELPQLVNVLRGEMSFVGPRPEVPRYVDMFAEAYQELLAVRPGITDLASLTFRDEETLLARSANAEELYVHEILPLKLALSRAYVRRLHRHPRRRAAPREGPERARPRSAHVRPEAAPGLPREPALRAHPGRRNGCRQAGRGHAGSVCRRAPRGSRGRSGVRARRELHVARERDRDAPDQGGRAGLRGAAAHLLLELLGVRDQHRRGGRDERGQPGLPLRAQQGRERTRAPPQRRRELLRHDPPLRDGLRPLAAPALRPGGESLHRPGHGGREDHAHGAEPVAALRPRAGPRARDRGRARGRPRAHARAGLQRGRPPAQHDDRPARRARPEGRVARAPRRDRRDGVEGPAELCRLVREDPSRPGLRGGDVHGERDRGDRLGVQEGELRPLQGRRLLERRDDEEGTLGLPAGRSDGARPPARRGARARAPLAERASRASGRSPLTLGASW